MILKYKDQSIRIVVPGPFLKDAWEESSMILWISDKIPLHNPLIHSGNGDSLTDFKKDLFNYLTSYKFDDLKSWIQTVEKANFQSVNVFLMISTPGLYSINDKNLGHHKIKTLLAKYSSPVKEQSPVVVVTKDLSSFGTNNEFLNEICSSMTHGSTPNNNIIMTSASDMQNSFHRDWQVNYSSIIHQGQNWGNNSLFHWRGNTEERTKALHKIKAYARWTDDGLYWFIFGSPNLTKSAWGASTKYKGHPAFSIRNFELAVMFLPRIFVSSTFQYELIKY